jgi:DoxX-like family
LTTLIVVIDSTCVRATSVGRHRVPGSCRYPVKEILMKRNLNLALWIVAGILAVAFLVSSSTKLFVPKEKLAGMGGAASRWVEDFSPSALRAIGALEFLAAVGLIVPAVLGIAPVLVPLAATGAVLLFAGAVIMRLRRGERATIIADLVYLAMAAFVAWGRFGPGSFTRPAQRDVNNRARLRRIARGASRTAVDSFPERAPRR